MSTALPAHFALHLWWACWRLIPSRAAIIASLDRADTDPETFIRQLGIERVQALLHYCEPCQRGSAPLDVALG